MSEENSLDERNKRTIDATKSNSITLLTRLFGRGIDFVVNDYAV